MRILVVEDEKKVSAFLKEGLETSEYEVDIAIEGNKAKELALNIEYDVVLLDVIIPGINGFDLCRQIRKEKPHLPILMLTALGTMDDKLTGFNVGADDYLAKPFEFKELLARLKALTRRGVVANDKSVTINLADLELDLKEKIAVRAGKKISLTAKEFALLEYFMRNPGRVLSRMDIAEKVWDITFDTGTNVVDVYVNLLRKKIDKSFNTKLIHTRVGMGYIFKEE